jgi:hypothetical protein
MNLTGHAAEPGVQHFHGQADLFLTANDVDPDELEANKDVIVTEMPAAQ